MKPRLVVAALLLASFAIRASAQDVLPHNAWVDLVSESQKSTLAGNSFQGTDYFAWMPVVVQPGGKYTLIAQWDDGKAMLVIFQGHDPRAAAPSLPSGSSKSATINSSGGKDWRINLTVDTRSTGNAGYLVFAAGSPGRKVRVMLKDPGDPDAETTAVVNGRYIGTVFSTPVYATGKVEAAAPVAAAPAAVDGLPLNEWVSFPSPSTASRLASFESDGEKYYAVTPVRLEKGRQYTLFAEWDDGKAMLLFVRGYDPAGKAPSAPSGTYNQVTINSSGGKAWRINFTVDPKSVGDTAWLVFPAAAPGRALRIMVKSPGDPDEVTTAVVKGSYVGSVYQTPLHLFAR
jgi:hypothetical protein